MSIWRSASVLLALLTIATDASNVGEVLTQQQGVTQTKKVAVSKTSRSSSTGSPEQCIESWYVSPVSAVKQISHVSVSRGSFYCFLRVALIATSQPLIVTLT